MARPSVGRCAASPTRVSATSPLEVGLGGIADALLPAAVATATGVFCWLATRALIPFLRRRDSRDWLGAARMARPPRGRAGRIGCGRGCARHGPLGARILDRRPARSFACGPPGGARYRGDDRHSDAARGA